MAARDVIVIGAGPAGLATALACKDVGLQPLVVEREQEVASSWKRRYDRLRLNTCRPFSHLPDRPFPKGTPMFPVRDQLVEHLQRHAAEDGLELRLATPVERVEPRDGGWTVRTPAGDLDTAQVVVATGHEHEPEMPRWPGMERFGGELLHSSAYRNPEPFRDRRVLVVGCGCSGMEIAYDLVEGGAAKVWLGVRTPPNIVLREGPGGLPGDVFGVALLHVPPKIADRVTRFAQRMDVGDLSAYGLPVPEEGVFTRMARTGQAPALLDRPVIEAIKARRIEVVRDLRELDASGVVLGDGGRIEPDAIICATGYRRGLEPLVGHLGVLDDRGLPRALGEQPAAPGLRFIGYVPRPGGLGYMAREAKRAARAMRRELSSGSTTAAAIPA